MIYIYIIILYILSIYILYIYIHIKHHQTFQVLQLSGFALYCRPLHFSPQAGNWFQVSFQLSLFSGVLRCGLHSVRPWGQLQRLVLRQCIVSQCRSLSHWICHWIIMIVHGIMDQSSMIRCFQHFPASVAEIFGSNFWAHPRWDVFFVVS